MTDHLHSSGSFKYLAMALGITITFFVVELIGGVLTKSLALVTDAWHMLNDVVALFFAVVAAWFARRPVDMRKTYGYYRAEILAGFLNGIFLWAIVAFIFYEALQRLQRPSSVESLNMLIIAVLGLAANGLSVLALSRSKEESLNFRGAFLHVVADTLGSLGAIVAGVTMYFTEWYQADPLISMAIGVLIFYTSAKLVRDSANVLLEGAPHHIDISVLKHRILSLNDVAGIHDVHVWCITPTRMCCMSAHIVEKKGTNRKKLISTLMELLKDEFGIDHTTIQLEEEGYPKALSEH